MFYVNWRSKRGRWHTTGYADPFKAINAFRQHERAYLVRGGLTLATKK